MPGQRKIALIGSAPSSIHLAPYQNPEWDIWGCSPGAYPILARERVTAFFELHRWEPPVIGRGDLQVPWFSPEYCAWMAGLKVPVWMAEVVPEVPNSVRYPREQMIAEYGPYFFTSSLSYMLAMALMLDDVGEIGLWGVDMSATEEWGYQRAGCHHFLTIAWKRGIKVTLPPESDLLQPPMLYGIGENDPMAAKLLARKKELEMRLNVAMQNANNAQQEIAFMRGALDDLNYMYATWMTEAPDWAARLKHG